MGVPISSRGCRSVLSLLSKPQRRPQRLCSEPCSTRAPLARRSRAPCGRRQTA